MIRLKRYFTPIKLNPSFVKDKTDEYKRTSKAVWNIDWLKESLLHLSSYKCAYCECSLKEESNYMEVDHFEDKNHNPHKVMLWENLIPSCKKCNGAKSDHDVITEPIINPFLDVPKDEIYFRLYHLKGKTAKGKNTEDVVNINHPTRAVIKRFEVGEGLNKLLEQAKDRLVNYNSNKIVRRKNKFLNIVEDILNECQPESIYSANCATILHSSLLYLEIKEYLKNENLWSEEMEQLHKRSLETVLEMR